MYLKCLAHSSCIEELIMLVINKNKINLPVFVTLILELKLYM